MDEQWRRPVDTRQVLRIDFLFALVFGGCALLSMETARSLGSLLEVEMSVVEQLLWVVVPILTLVVRRLFPLTVLAIATVHLILTAIFAPMLSPVFFVQVYYFFSLFNAMAWAWHRIGAMVLALVFALVAGAWILYDFLIRQQLETLALQSSYGVFSATTAAVLQVLLSTTVFYLSATLAGVLTWWRARREDAATQQAITIAKQTAELSERAVGEERLRIARELHDVVGRHVSVIGIQTSAARRVLTTDPDKAVEAMSQVEHSARAATQDLRLLLSALRVRDEKGTGEGAHDGIGAMRTTVESFRRLGLRIDVRESGDLERIPSAPALALHRILQEALVNVRRHSTADHVDVCVEVLEDTSPREVRLRVVDNGRPRGNTSGSQVGLVGMRERVELHNGSLRTSTTENGGYCVEACLTWPQENT
ncbi:sensor histidine kinase [Actinopolyspora xinjiangensis]|uniref:sensor histidine kinase n=1 Tax=Actinopolyspora xinjiangensis TaxID=405564 RepID=UPI00147AEE1C|nr:sensor histidine kinase [Actinopolyspora xinjiangensis]